MLATLGRGDLADGQDDWVVYEAPSGAYRAQAREFDPSGRGFFTVGDGRNVMRTAEREFRKASLKPPLDALQSSGSGEDVDSHAERVDS